MQLWVLVFLSPPTPGSPRSTSPAKPPPPRRETQTPCPAPPPKPTQPKKPSMLPLQQLHWARLWLVFQPAKPRRSECLAQPTGNVLIGSA